MQLFSLCQNIWLVSRCQTRLLWTALCYRVKEVVGGVKDEINGTEMIFELIFLSTVIAIPVLPLKFSYYVSALDIHFNSWRLLNLIFCLPCAISTCGLFFALESPKYLLSVGKEDEALEVLKTIFVINNKKSREEYPVSKCFCTLWNVYVNYALFQLS